MEKEPGQKGEWQEQKIEDLTVEQLAEAIEDLEEEIIGYMDNRKTDGFESEDERDAYNLDMEGGRLDAGERQNGYLAEYYKRTGKSYRSSKAGSRWAEAESGK